MTEWFSDEDFWRDFFPVMFGEQRFEQAAHQAEQLFAWLGEGFETVLDLCCGPGRFAIPMARRGLTVTAVDRSPYLLDRGRMSASAECREIEWVASDMRDFRRPESFDLIVNLFTSFGYFESRAEDFAVLELIFANLKPGGTCVIDVLGKERLARQFQPIHATALSEGRVLVEKHEICEDWTRIRNEWILVQGERARSFEFTHNIYSGLELRDRLESAGFQEIRLCGDFDGSDYGSDSPRLIVVGGKPG